MSRTLGALGKVTEAFAAAAVDPTRWDAAMDVAARATGSAGAILIPWKGQLPVFPMSDGMQPAVEAYVRDGWMSRDVRYRPQQMFLQRGVASEFDFTTPEQMARDPYYQEFLRPHKLRWYGGVRVGGRQDAWCLSIQRSIEQGPFGPLELKRLALLSHRLAGAAELACAFGFARVESALAAFEASRSPVAMIDRFGKVFRLNPSAERLLGVDLKVIERRLVSRDRAAAAALDRALHNLIWSRTEAAFHSPVVLPRLNGRPIIAYPARLSASVREGFALCQGFVVFVDLEARLGPVANDASLALGLTCAEARLADSLLCETSLEAAAESLGVAVGTARNQLKSIYQKTDTHGQGQLIALLMRLATSRPNLA